MSFFKIVSLFLIACWFQLALSATEDLQALQQLLDSKQTKHAYQKAQKLREHEEGNPEFDLLYGQAAYQNQQYHNAMFALERVVHAEPENINARYLLALTYHAMHNTSAAQREFKRVQAMSPPPDVARVASNHLTTIKNNDGNNSKQPSLLGYAEASVGYDNNISRSTDDQTITIPTLLPTPIASSARQQGDSYRRVGGKLQYFYPLQKDLGLNIQGSVSDKDFFSDDLFDETLYKVNATLHKKINQDTFKAGVKTQAYYLSDSNYSIANSLTGSWHHPTSEKNALSAGINYSTFNYPGNGLLNVSQKAFHAGIHRRTGNRYHSLGAMLVDESADHSAGKHNARTARYWFYDLNLYLDATNSLQARLLYNDTWRDTSDPVFLVDRNDDLLSFTAVWQWRYDDHFTVNTRLGTSKNDSNIDLYQYKRRYLETGIRYVF